MSNEDSPKSDILAEGRSTTTMTPQQIANSFDLDQRAVVLARPGTFVANRLGRAWWNLRLDGVLVKDVGQSRISLTELGVAVRRVLLDGFVDEEQGWGIQFVGRGEDCWWRPEAKGYTLKIYEAGLYSRKDALRMHGGERCNAGRDIAFPPCAMRILMEASAADAADHLAKLEAAQASLAV